MWERFLRWMERVELRLYHRFPPRVPKPKPPREKRGRPLTRKESLLLWAFFLLPFFALGIVWLAFRYPETRVYLGITEAGFGLCFGIYSLLYPLSRAWPERYRRGFRPRFYATLFWLLSIYYVWQGLFFFGRLPHAIEIASSLTAGITVLYAGRLDLERRRRGREEGTQGAVN